MADVLERGAILFAYRPRVEREQVRGVEDVQRLFVVMEPEPGDRFRRLVIGRKRLPDVAARDRFWGFVDRVANRPQDLREDLEASTYPTRTRGWRLQPEARAAADGTYVIARHGDHTHLGYELASPKERGEPQEELNIEPEASYVIALKNPAAPSRLGMDDGSDESSDVSQRIRERFGNRGFAPADPPEMLDVEGIEFVLIGASEDVGAELGVDLDAERASDESKSMLDELKLASRRSPG